MKEKIVKANLVYSPTGKRPAPLRVDIICDAAKSEIWENATIKEVTKDNFFIDKLGDGTPVKNENNNRGVSFSRFISEKRGSKPKDRNALNVTLSNWIYDDDDDDE